jgi:hypothetical protein
MDVSDFISSHGRLPTPSECTQQIKKLDENTDLLYTTIHTDTDNPKQLVTFESHKLYDLYTEARLKAIIEGARYSYIRVALEAELPEDEIHETRNSEPKIGGRIVDDYIADYYRYPIKQMIAWKAQKTLALCVVPSF